MKVKNGTILLHKRDNFICKVTEKKHRSILAKIIQYDRWPFEVGKTYEIRYQILYEEYSIYGLNSNSIWRELNS